MRGRVVARYYLSAMKKTRELVESKGYRLAPGARVVPSPVQPWPDRLIWWDFNVEIIEIGDGINGCKAGNYF